MYHAAINSKVEFQPFKRLYSQLTSFNFLQKKSSIARQPIINNGPYRTIRLRKGLGEMFPTQNSFCTYTAVPDCRDIEQGKSAQWGVIHTVVHSRPKRWWSLGLVTPSSPAWSSVHCGKSVHVIFFPAFSSVDARNRSCSWPTHHCWVVIDGKWRENGCFSRRLQVCTPHQPDGGGTHCCTGAVQTVWWLRRSPYTVCWLKLTDWSRVFLSCATLTYTWYRVPRRWKAITVLN